MRLFIVSDNVLAQTSPIVCRRVLQQTGDTRAAISSYIALCILWNRLTYSLLKGHIAALFVTAVAGILSEPLVEAATSLSNVGLLTQSEASYATLIVNW